MFSLLRCIFVITVALIAESLLLPAAMLPVEKLHRDIVLLLGGLIWMCGEIVQAIKEQKK